MPIAYLTDLTMTEKKGLDKEGIQQITQFRLDALGLSLLMHVDYELNMQRRHLMKPDIGKTMPRCALCRILLPDYLFGDGLQKQLKVSKQASKKKRVSK